MRCAPGTLQCAWCVVAKTQSSEAEGWSNVAEGQRLPELHAVAEQVRARAVSPLELLDEALARADQLEPRLNAIITVCADEARADARRAEQEIMAGDYRGPLHGIPMTMKDLYTTAGIRTTAGSRILADWVPDEDAAAVERLKAAGAVIFAKTNMLDFAYASVHPDYGATRNPWNLSRSASGSSGGSAACVAAGIGFGSFGSDTGGSIRIPASVCGIAGLKPTYGLVSTYGVLPLSWTLDHAGPFARSVRDVAILLDAVAGYDPRDPRSAESNPSPTTPGLDSNLAGMSVGVVRNFVDATLDDAVASAFAQAVSVLADAGATVTEIEIPELESASATTVQKIMPPEASYVHRKWFPERESDYSETVAKRLRAGLAGLAVDYFAGIDEQKRIQARMRELQREIDVLVLPTTAFTAVPLELTTLPASVGEKGFAERVRRTAPFNLTGQPALSIPCGFSSGGLPIGLQIVGRLFEDGVVLRAGHAYQARTDWHGRVPTFKNE
jgi:aspartyl-tRNA(Asn)/glutamyl-tRNA(Gln) amidotransferase subunit A